MPIYLKTTIEIDATPSEIWNCLINFSSYPEWNPFITELEGIPAVNNQLKANIGGMKFNPIVLDCEPDKKLVWKGKLLFRGLFDGEHSFEIIDKETHCTFIQSEKFSGILVPFFKKKLEKDTRNGFISMNEALKKLVENKKNL